MRLLWSKDRDVGADMNQIREDRRLVRRLLNGDDAAYEQLFEDYFGGLYRFALTRLDFDETLAQEVVQATMLKAIEKLDTFRGEAALFSWLCSVCRREITAHFRRQQRAPVEVDLIENTPEIRAVLDALATGAEGPEDALRRKEVGRLVHLTLDHLPPRYGRALEWKYFEGLSVKEIAARLQVSPKAAESVMSRAREAFRTGFAALARGLDGHAAGLRLVPSERNG